MSRFLFLDFDGVLNAVTPAGYVPAHPSLDRQCVARVARVVEELALSVVCSSSWREDYTLDQLKALLRAAGGDVLADALIDVTPIYEKVPKRRHVRAAEVADWLKDNAPEAAYVVIDDSDKFSFPPEVFVRTVGAMGFSDADALAARAILTRT